MLYGCITSNYFGLTIPEDMLDKYLENLEVDNFVVVNDISDEEK